MRIKSNLVVAAREITRMGKMLLAIFLSIYAGVGASEPCLHVRMADIRCADISATTALAREILVALKYKSYVTNLSLPDTFIALENNNIDIFLGNWMPAQAAYTNKFLEEKSLEQGHKNLGHARFSLAVPSYIYDAGIRLFYDLQKYAEKCEEIICALVPLGNGNNIIKNMLLSSNLNLSNLNLSNLNLSNLNLSNLNLSNWNMRESSEQKILQESNKSVAEKKWIVFLGLALLLILTVIFAIPALLRLTYLGIKEVPKELIVAGESLGTYGMKRLLTIEISYVMPLRNLGFTQCIMLSLLGIIIAALVTVQGLSSTLVSR